MKLSFNKKCSPKGLNLESIISEKFRVMFYEDETIIEIFDVNEKRLSEIDKETGELLKEWVEYEKVIRSQIEIEEEDNLITKDIVEVEQIDYSKTINDIIEYIKNNDFDKPLKTEMEKLQEVVDMLLVDSLEV